MKPITLHPGSLLAGVGLAILAFVAMGQQVASTGTPPRAELDPVVTRPLGALPVEPRDWFTIYEATPYSVPTGKLLVVRAIGQSQGFMGDVSLRVDGIVVFTSDSGSGGGHRGSMREVPRLLTVPEGALVELDSPGTTNLIGRAWGYLADA